MKKFLAESIGTFALVLLGCGAAVIAGHTSAQMPAGLGLLGISLAFGLSVVVMAYAVGNISGCHLNPAVTVAMLVAKKIDIANAMGYVIAQLVGAVLASAVLSFILHGNPGFVLSEWGLGSNGWGPGYLGEYSQSAAFITEALMTFIFVFVIFAVTSKLGNSNMAGLAIGLTLVLIHLFSIPITGTSVNPARSFGPAIIVGGVALKQLWLFIAAPITGGILAAVIWKGIFENEK